MKTRFKTQRTVALSLALAAVGLQATPAQACGGFFCNAANPVNQAAERIIFAQDGDKVTQIVEVAYEGEAAGFAWVLPVPGTPVPGVSSVQALDRLQQATNPTYRTNDNRPESCNSNQFSGDGDVAFSAGSPESADDSGGIVVLDSGSVGPYDFDTISVVGDVSDPAKLATDWLEANDYDLGDRAAETLGPYLQNGMNLIAFRLQSGQDDGAIRPISLEYTAKTSAIPIIPTSVAAAPDMPILVWVLGDSRAIPSNYKGLELNELLIDWFNPNDTYNAVVTAAANEAKGQGFVTEMAMPADSFADIIHRSWEETEQYISPGADIQNALQGLTDQFGSYDGYVQAVAEALPLRSGITPEEFTSCSYCYFDPENAWTEGFGGAGGVGEPISEDDPIYGTDLLEFANALEEHVFGPLKDTAALFDKHSHVTRFYTTMSADEMTEDPIFEFNPDLEDVSNAHVAERDYRTCEGDAWVVTLPSGEKVYGEGNTWPHALDSSEMPANVRILQYSTSGEPTVVEDFQSSILSTHEESVAGTRPSSWSESSSGCSVGTPQDEPAPLAPWLLLAGLGVGGAFFARRHSENN